MLLQTLSDATRLDVRNSVSDEGLFISIHMTLAEFAFIYPVDYLININFAENFFSM